MLVPSFRPSQAPWSARCRLEHFSIWYDMEGPLPVYFHRLRSRKFSTSARAGSQRATERWAGQGSAGFRGHGSVGRRAHGCVLKGWAAKTGYWGAVSPSPPPMSLAEGPCCPATPADLHQPCPPNAHRRQPYASWPRQCSQLGRDRTSRRAPALSLSPSLRAACVCPPCCLHAPV